MTDLSLALTCLSGVAGMLLVAPFGNGISLWQKRTRGGLTSMPKRPVVKAVAALLGAAAAIVLFPGEAPIPVGALGAASSAALAWLVEHLVSNRRRQRRTSEVNLAVVSLLEQVHLKLVNGNSLNAALANAEGVTNPDVAQLQNLLRSGLDLETAASFWLAEFDTESKRRLTDLFLAKTTTSETLALLSALTSQLRKEQRFSLIAEIERRNRLVWIPVTIAVLVPGMIFIAIPLEATLHSLLN